MSNNEAELNNAKPIGRTIARANARLITTEETQAVCGAELCLPSHATTCQCVSYGGVDYGGFDCS